MEKVAGVIAIVGIVAVLTVMIGQRYDSEMLNVTWAALKQNTGGKKPWQ